jgi:protein involved in polysaccharide export with SLBB domain
MAGGLIPSAYTQQIQVERIERNEREIVIDINDKDLVKSKNITIQDGDLVKVFPIVEKDDNAVFLLGNIKRPGKYEYRPGMRIKDLIGSTTDLLKETYLEYALIKRRLLPELKEELIPFNPGKVLIDGDTQSNIFLTPKDRVYIFPKWFFKDTPYFTVEGEVRQEGKFELLKNHRVKDAILEAGGLTKDASLRSGEIFRTDDNGQVTQIYFEVDPAMNEDAQNNVLLQDRDQVVIHSLWETRYKQTVAINGDVKNPGEYPMSDNMHISDLIFAAGNILESAYLNDAEVTSFKIDTGSKVEMERKTVDLQLALQHDPAHDLLLSPYDSIFVKRIPDWSEKRFVSLTGEFMFPGTYIISKGETLASVINRAGGYSDRAYLRGAVFTRESIKKQQQQSITEMVKRLERQLFTRGSVEASAAASETEVEAKKIEQEQQKKFLESLKTVEATGRMSIRMAHPRLLKGSSYDIALEHNDNLHIPVNNSVVNVTGAVMSQGSFIYSDKLNYKDYIEMSGGYAKYADKKNVYVLKVDGSAMKLSQGFTRWNDSRARWELTSFSDDIREIEPGDTIIVPEKLDRIAWLRHTQSLTQILYQVAVTAGVAVVLF